MSLTQFYENFDQNYWKYFVPVFQKCFLAFSSKNGCFYKLKEFELDVTKNSDLGWRTIIALIVVILIIVIIRFKGSFGFWENSQKIFSTINSVLIESHFSKMSHGQTGRSTLVKLDGLWQTFNVLQLYKFWFSKSTVILAKNDREPLV